MSLVVVRVLAGIGEAAFFVGAASMITDLSPEARRGEAISYWSVAVYGGLAFGPLLGNVMLDDDHFDRVWIVSAALAFVAAVIGLFTRETVTPAEPAPRRGRPAARCSAARPSPPARCCSSGSSAWPASPSSCRCTSSRSA